MKIKRGEKKSSSTDRLYHYVDASRGSSILAGSSCILLVTSGSVPHFLYKCDGLRDSGIEKLQMHLPTTQQANSSIHRYVVLYQAVFFELEVKGSSAQAKNLHCPRTAPIPLQDHLDQILLERIHHVSIDEAVARILRLVW